MTIEERVNQLTARYSAEADVYERVWAPMLREAGNRLLSRIPLNVDSKVLDVGAGVGALLPDISALVPGGVTVGVDRSKGMLSHASSDYPVAVMDASRLGLRAATFDAVTMTFILFHLPDPSDGLKEAHRVLGPRGSIGIANWAAGDEEWPAFEIWTELLDEHGADPPSPVLSQHELVNTGELLEELLSAAGFERIETWVETIERTWDIDSFIQFVTGMAIPKRRYDSIDPRARPTLIETLRGRLEDLGPTDLTHRAQVLFATAAAGGSRV
jgi:SAM-dependent methyltransferase